MAARARLTPEAVGLHPGGRRRVAGLRRSEIAELADVSEAWYKQFETGRARVSLAALQRVSQALRLDPHERLTLFRLARPELDGLPGTAQRRTVERPGTLRLGSLNVPGVHGALIRALRTMVQKTGTRIEQIEVPWVLQNEFLESGDLDVAVTYGFDDVPIAGTFCDYPLLRTLPWQIAISPRARNAATALDPSSLHRLRLLGPKGRLGTHIQMHARSRGYQMHEYYACDTFAHMVETLSREMAYTFVMDHCGADLRDAGFTVRPAHDFVSGSSLVVRTRAGDSRLPVAALIASIETVPVVADASELSA